LRGIVQRLAKLDNRLLHFVTGVLKSVDLARFDAFGSPLALRFFL
jgi:hypothetical protein